MSTLPSFLPATLRVPKLKEFEKRLQELNALYPYEPIEGRATASEMQRWLGEVRGRHLVTDIECAALWTAMLDEILIMR